MDSQGRRVLGEPGEETRSTQPPLGLVVRAMVVVFSAGRPDHGLRRCESRTQLGPERRRDDGDGAVAVRAEGRSGRDPARRGRQIVPGGDSWGRDGLRFQSCQGSVRREDVEVSLKKLIAGGVKGTPSVGGGLSSDERGAGLQRGSEGGEFG